jgi:hypothetical protein
MNDPLRIIVSIIIIAATTIGMMVSSLARAQENMSNQTPTNQAQTQAQHPYIGMWVTGDGRIRQELLPTGRYDEARGSRKSAYQGRYEVRGTHIDYWDDTGFTADGTFVDNDTLHHGGMIFYREK